MRRRRVALRPLVVRPRLLVAWLGASAQRPRAARLGAAWPPAPEAAASGSRPELRPRPWRLVWQVPTMRSPQAQSCPALGDGGEARDRTCDSDRGSGYAPGDPDAAAPTCTAARGGEHAVAKRPDGRRSDRGERVRVFVSEQLAQSTRNEYECARERDGHRAFATAGSVTATQPVAVSGSGSSTGSASPVSPGDAAGNGLAGGSGSPAAAGVGSSGGSPSPVSPGDAAGNGLAGGWGRRRRLAWVPRAGRRRRCRLVS